MLIHTSHMNLGEDVDLDELVNTKEDLSGADAKVLLLDKEAGYLH